MGIKERVEGSLMECGITWVRREELLGPFHSMYNWYETEPYHYHHSGFAAPLVHRMYRTEMDALLSAKYHSTETNFFKDCVLLHSAEEPPVEYTKNVRDTIKDLKEKKKAGCCNAAATLPILEQLEQGVQMLDLLQTQLVSNKTPKRYRDKALTTFPNLPAAPPTHRKQRGVKTTTFTGLGNGRWYVGYGAST